MCAVLLYLLLVVSCYRIRRGIRFHLFLSTPWWWFFSCFAYLARTSPQFTFVWSQIVIRIRFYCMTHRCILDKLSHWTRAVVVRITVISLSQYSLSMITLRKVSSYNFRSSCAPLLMVPKVSNTFQDLASRSFYKSPSNIRNIYFIRSLNRQKNTFNCVNDKIIEYDWLLIGTIFPIDE